jgi:hypothetical protein
MTCLLPPAATPGPKSIVEGVDLAVIEILRITGLRDRSALHRLSAIDGLRWSPKTGQVAKRESSLGTVGWLEVRLVEYTEKAQS